MDKEFGFNALKILHSIEISVDKLPFSYIFVQNDLVIQCPSISYNETSSHVDYFRSLSFSGTLEVYFYSLIYSISNLFTQERQLFNFFCLVILLSVTAYTMYTKKSFVLVQTGILDSICKKITSYSSDCVGILQDKTKLFVFDLTFYWRESQNFNTILSHKNLALFVILPSKWIPDMLYVFQHFNCYGSLDYPGVRENTHQGLTPQFIHLAHELKLPLFNIKSFLETLYEYNFKLTDIQRMEFLETATREANRLVHLIDNILAFHSLKSLHGHNCYPTDSFNLMEIIIQVVNSYSLISINKKVQFLYNLNSPRLCSYGNSELIAQVVNNLAGNSLKYTFIQKKILIRARVFTSFSHVKTNTHNKIQICVLDQGIGIPGHNLDETFKNRVSAQKIYTHPKVKGNGLGLTIVKQILSYHRTNLNVLSRVNRGSIIGFTISAGDLA